MTPIFTPSDITVITNSEPRLQDLVLAERLGMANPHDIRTTIDSNKVELEGFGEVSRQRRETTNRGGRPGIAYYLNEPQALLICMFSRTPRAAQVRKALIEVFQAYRQGHVPRGAAREPASVNDFKIDPTDRKGTPGAKYLVLSHGQLRATEIAEVPGWGLGLPDAPKGWFYPATIIGRIVPPEGRYLPPIEKPAPIDVNEVWRWIADRSGQAFHLRDAATAFGQPFNKRAQMRMARILRDLGCERVFSNFGRERGWYWVYWPHDRAQVGTN